MLWMNAVIFWEIIFLHNSINNEPKLSIRGAEIIKKFVDIGANYCRSRTGSGLAVGMREVDDQEREYVYEQNVLQLHIRRANKKFIKFKICVDGSYILLNSIDTAIKGFAS